MPHTRKDFEMISALAVVGACHINVQNIIHLGAYSGVGTYCSSSKNGYLGAYPGVGACPGDYGITILHSICEALNCHIDY